MMQEPADTLVQRASERLAQQARAQIYQIFEVALGEDALAALVQMDSSVADVVSQVQMSFQHAVQSKLLPELRNRALRRSAASNPLGPGFPALEADTSLMMCVPQNILEDINSPSAYVGTPDSNHPSRAASSSLPANSIGQAGDLNQQQQHLLQPNQPLIHRQQQQQLQQQRSMNNHGACASPASRPMSLPEQLAMAFEGSMPMPRISQQGSPWPHSPGMYQRATTSNAGGGTSAMFAMTSSPLALRNAASEPFNNLPLGYDQQNVLQRTATGTIGDINRLLGSQSDSGYAPNIPPSPGLNSYTNQSGFGSPSMGLSLLASANSSVDMGPASNGQVGRPHLAGLPPVNLAAARSPGVTTPMATSPLGTGHASLGSRFGSIGSRSPGPSRTGRPSASEGFAACGFGSEIRLGAGAEDHLMLARASNDTGGSDSAGPSSSFLQFGRMSLDEPASGSQAGHEFMVPPVPHSFQGKISFAPGPVFNMPHSPAASGYSHSGDAVMQAVSGDIGPCSWSDSGSCSSSHASSCGDAMRSMGMDTFAKSPHSPAPVVPSSPGSAPPGELQFGSYLPPATAGHADQHQAGAGTGQAAGGSMGGPTSAAAAVMAGRQVAPDSPSAGKGRATSGKAPELPGRFKVLPAAVQARVQQIVQANPVISMKDFDDKVVSKLCILVDTYGKDECLAMLNHLEHRMRTKQGSMKNGPGYLDVAVCTHLDMLKAQGSCPKSMKLEDYAKQVLAPQVFEELKDAVDSNRWLQWDHFDQGIIQLIKKLPREGAVEKLQEISYHSFKNVDNIKGCIMSILNSKIREDRRKQSMARCHGSPPGSPYFGSSLPQDDF